MKSKHSSLASLYPQIRLNRSIVMEQLKLQSVEFCLRGNGAEAVSKVNIDIYYAEETEIFRFGISKGF